ncbi:MAG: FAD-binding oxidoreductase [Acidobacteriota bacterium]
MRPIEQSCYWLATRTRDPLPPLEAGCDADIVVVGAGFTGLWAALTLRELEPGRSVVVLEQGCAAYGASGRNAGMVGEGLDHSHGLAVAHFGEQGAAALARLGRRNLDELVEFVASRGIDCDLERNGFLDMALTPGQVKDLDEALPIAHRLGMTHIRRMNRDEARAEVHSDLYQGALLNPHPVIVDPVKLVEGLLGEAHRLGARIFERTPVQRIERDGAGLRLTTPGGTVRAGRVILATNAYTHYLVPSLRRSFLPLYDYVLVSDPLTPEQRDAIGWRGRQGIGDARNFFNYYRLTADDRVLWGTSEAVYYRGDKVDASCDHSAHHYETLRAGFRRHFPALAKLEFPYAWGGPICATTRFTPFFGSTEGGRIVYGLGYTGHGVSSTRLVGRTLAHLAVDRAMPYPEMAPLGRRPLPYPPEPLRGMMVRRVTRDLRRVDEDGDRSLLLRFLDAIGVGLSS